jgi:hypothetical protein
LSPPHLFEWVFLVDPGFALIAFLHGFVRKSCLKRVTTTGKKDTSNGDDLLRNNTQSSAFGKLRLIHLRIDRAEKRGLPVGSEPPKRFPAEKRPIQFVPKRSLSTPEGDSPRRTVHIGRSHLVKRPNHKRTNGHLFRKVRGSLACASSGPRHSGRFERERSGETRNARTN